jgi:hypothetical protein
MGAQLSKKIAYNVIAACQLVNENSQIDGILLKNKTVSGLRS